MAAGRRRVSVVEARREIVVVACAVSAGIHGALVPAHLAEGEGAGPGFVAATVALAAVVVWLTYGSSRRAFAAAAALLGGLIVSYALVVTAGLPVLHPHAEPPDGLALATKAIEAAGLLAASSLLRRRRLAPILPRPKGTPT